MNELTKHRQTALHLAAQQDLATICSVLIENAIDFSAVDENGNNGTSLMRYEMLFCRLLVVHNIVQPAKVHAVKMTFGLAVQIKPA